MKYADLQIISTIGTIYLLGTINTPSNMKMATTLGMMVIVEKIILKN